MSLWVAENRINDKMYVETSTIEDVIALVRAANKARVKAEVDEETGEPWGEEDVELYLDDLAPRSITLLSGMPVLRASPAEETNP